MTAEPTPPRLAELLLKLVLPRGLAGESIKGDLDQEFAESLATSSLGRARAWYFMESLRFAVRYAGMRNGAPLGSRPGIPRSTGDNIMSVLWQDTRHASRRLARSPLFSLVAVLTFAVGIGANTAIFSLVNGILLKPLPFDEPDHLVGVWHTAPGLGIDDVNQAPALHFTYLDEGRFFSEIGMWDGGTASVMGLDEPEEVEIMEVTEGTFRALRLQPVLGRLFNSEDDSPAGQLTVVLSYDYWQSSFGADPGVLGRSINVEGRPREIIGVLGEDVYFLDRDPAFYLPFRFDRSEIALGDFSYQGLARLAPGVTSEQASADVARMLPMAVDKFPGGVTLEMLEQGRFGPNIRPLRDEVVGDVGEVLWVLLGTVAVILLIACATVSNLFLVRAETREKEMAVRTALGANAGDVRTMVLKQGMILCGVGVLFGLAAAIGLTRLMEALLCGVEPVDPVTFGAVTASLTVVALIASYIPAARAAGIDPVEAIRCEA